MGVVFRIVRYLAGAALVLAGAGYVAFVLAVPLARRGGQDSAEVAERSPFDRMTQAFVEADPKHLAVGAAVALAGLLIARAPFSMAPAKGRARERKRLPPGKAVADLRAADPEVRLEAATDLLSAARPSSIPALIKALEDPTTKVRGQACEALANMTGETFDFVDVAPEPVRAESVARWRAWWQVNKDAILSGADPRDVADAAAATAGLSTEEPELPPLDDDVPTREFAGAGAAAPAAQPRGTTRAPAPGRRASSRRGRRVSLEDVLRKKRMREAREAARGQPKPGPAVPGPGPAPAAPPVPAAPAQPETEEAPGDSIDLTDLPSPDDDELPPID